MYRPVLLLVLVISITSASESQQSVQGVESLASLTGDPSTQLAALQRNISSLWTYIYELRGAVTHHLNHLREHQVEMESAIHRLEHHGDGHGESHAPHTAHSGEHHSHGGDDHSHSGENHAGHSSEHHHHSGEHHSHGGDDHSHGGGDHSHSGEHQSHGHYHDSHSHSHTDGAGHGSDDHHHDHKDSHENADDLQQTSQVSEPLVEPVIVPTNVQNPSRHQHHSHGSHSHGSHSHSHGSHSHSSSSTGGPTFQPLNVMDYHHGHGSSSMVRNRNRTVVMPKYSEYDLYHFAVCNVQANRAIPVEQQQNIVGQISLWQKKTGGSLNIHVRLSGFAMGDHHAHHQQLQQEDDNETPPPMVHKHGFHIHTNADFSNGCQSTGPHYNPKGANHGGPNALVRHVGDLGNIECDDHGVANLAFTDSVASLVGQYSIVGKSMVIHSGKDDLGLGGDEESLRTGNAGTRLACCAIEKVEKLPIRSYKAMKTATQYQNY